MGKVRLYSEYLGREVEVPESPERIVSLSPAITETLYLLGLEDRIAGVSYFCHKPERAREKPKVGSYYKVEVDKLSSLSPDLVLTTTGAQMGVVETLVEKGFTVFPVPLPVSIHGVLDEIVTVGYVTGRIGEARRLARGLSQLLSRLAGSLEGVRLYYEVFLGGPVTAGGHSYISDALEYMGAETPFSRERVTWITNPDPSRIKEFNPDAILYEPSPYKRFTLEDVRRDLEKRGLGGLEALRTGRILLLEPDTLAHYGPSLIEDLAKIAERVKRVLGEKA
ncbi:MAG: ABC transporter substrate-binding protein [Desulfurococcales archaeon]|nr:ABC transporter substrate-binding protein [Desulfurococcales archaeon]